MHFRCIVCTTCESNCTLCYPCSFKMWFYNWTCLCLSLFSKIRCQAPQYRLEQQYKGKVNASAHVKQLPLKLLFHANSSFRSKQVIWQFSVGTWHRGKGKNPSFCLMVPTPVVREREQLQRFFCMHALGSKLWGWCCKDLVKRGCPQTLESVKWMLWQVGTAAFKVQHSVCQVSSENRMTVQQRVRCWIVTAVNCSSRPRWHLTQTQTWTFIPILCHFIIVIIPSISWRDLACSPKRSP